jgi:hypothetical protein
MKFRKLNLIWNELSALSSPPRRPTPAVKPPRRRSPRRPLHASDAVKTLPPPLIISPLNPPSNRALTALMAIHPAVTPATPTAPSPDPIKATPMTPGAPTPHRCLLLSSPAPETLPTEFFVTSSRHHRRPIATPPPKVW